MAATNSTNRTQKSRKIKALLAGGVVLGVGAAVTLAAWTDTEWAEGIFTAGSFNIEGSTDGVAYTDHASQDGAAVLNFDLTGAENMSPGDVVAAPFSMRLDEATTYDATVVLESAQATGANASALTYGIVQVDAVGDCTAAAEGTQIVPAGSTLTSIAGAQPLTLAAGADSAAGAAVNLCFQVTAGEQLEQGATIEAQWQFVGTSAD